MMIYNKKKTAFISNKNLLIDFYTGHFEETTVEMIKNSDNERCNVIYVPYIDKFLLFKFTQDESFCTTFTISNDFKIKIDTNWCKIPYNINIYSSEHCVLLGYQYIVYILSWQTPPIFYDIRHQRWYQSNWKFDKSLRISQMSWITNNKEDLYYLASSVNNLNQYQFDKRNDVFDMNIYLPSAIKTIIINNYQNDHKVLVDGYCRRMQNQIQLQTLLFNIPIVINQLIDGYYQDETFNDVSSLGLQAHEWRP